MKQKWFYSLVAIPLLVGTSSAQFSIPGATPIPSKPEPVTPVGSSEPITAPMAPASKLPPGVDSMLRPIDKVPTERNVVVDPKPTYKYELKPEHGDYLVIVKTYRGYFPRNEKERIGEMPDTAIDRDSAKKLAEGFAEWIRNELKLPAYLYERGWAKRIEESKRHAAEIERRYQEKKAQGIEIDRRMIKAPMTDYPDEYVVLVGHPKGAIRDMESAGEMAKYLRGLKVTPPSKFSDSFIESEDNVGTKVKTTAINPFATAFAAANPAIVAKTGGRPAPVVDAFIEKINASEPYSLIHAGLKKKYTLLVRYYTGSFEYVGGDGSSTAGPKVDNVGTGLQAAAISASNTANFLRKIKPSFDAYVFHDRKSSLVTVGEFDGPDDPNLAPVLKTLSGFKMVNPKTNETLDQLLEFPRDRETGKLQPILIPIPQIKK